MGLVVLLTAVPARRAVARPSVAIRPHLGACQLGPALARFGSDRRDAATGRVS